MNKKEMVEKQNEYDRKLKESEKIDKIRRKFVIKRAKELNKFKFLTVNTIGEDGTYCPNCNIKVETEEVWGLCSVFGYSHCNKCGWESGGKYPKPAEMME